ncbi:PPOX class F420-dependent oxidoreductase [Haliea atlantica]|tara:strand:+ start:48936 stop:49331 length:396 start_codon:yes stop_codon:yes gene_type:complete
MNRELMAQIDTAQYISLATRRRNGKFVPTPVWFAPQGGAYYVFSSGDAGKVKRLRNFSDARIAPCTVTGKLTDGWVEAKAQLIEDPAEIRSALEALQHKYGWQMRLINFLSRLSGRLKQRAYIRVLPRSGG